MEGAMRHTRWFIAVYTMAAALVLALADDACAGTPYSLGRGLKPKLWGTAQAPTTPPSGLPADCCKGNHQNAPGHGYHQNDLIKEVIHYYWTELRVRFSWPRRVLWRQDTTDEGGVWTNWVAVGTTAYYAGDPGSPRPTQAAINAAEPANGSGQVTFGPYDAVYASKFMHTDKAADDRVKVTYLMKPDCQACPILGGPCAGDYCTVVWGHTQSHSGGVDEEQIEWKCRSGKGQFRVTDEFGMSQNVATTADVDFSSYILVEEDDQYPRCGGRSWVWPQQFEMRYYHDDAVPFIGGTGLTIQKGVIGVNVNPGTFTDAWEFPPLNSQPAKCERGEDKVCPPPPSPLGYCGG